VNNVDEVRRRVREFVAERVIPVEPELDRGDAPTLARLRDAGRAEGLYALPLPVEYGGGGLSLSDYLSAGDDRSVAELEGASDHGPDVLNSACLLTVRMLCRHAHPDVRAELVPGLVSGRSRSCYAMTEPGAAGSDPATLRTVAVPAGDGDWILTGRKWFISGAGAADWAIVLARTSPDGPTRSAFTLFLVPSGDGGFRVERELDVLGGGGQFELMLPTVRVPATGVLGEVGQGLSLAGERIGLGRTLRALRWTGQAQRAVELLAARVSGRRLGSGVLADQQLMQALVFEAELAVRSARSLTARAASAVASGERSTVEVAMAKLAAARALGLAVDSAIQAYGAEGLGAHTGLPRLLRWARAARIMDGSDELLVSGTGRRLLRDYREGAAAAPATDRARCE